SEWFPALVSASCKLGGLPDNDGLVSFVPVHTAASALIELRHSPSVFAHLVHPRPVKWKAVIVYLSNILQLPVVSYEEWLTRLQAASTQELPESHPARQLLDFYETAVPPNGSEDIMREAMGLPMYATNNIVADCPSVSPEHLSTLNPEDVGRWVEYWRQKNVL
ncbi:hypothetical protein M422DRAFT_190942, partial [Sphaerobolus stellatus SS14]